MYIYGTQWKFLEGTRMITSNNFSTNLRTFGFVQLYSSTMTTTKEDVPVVIKDIERVLAHKV